MKKLQRSFEQRGHSANFDGMARYTIETKSDLEEEALLIFLNKGNYTYVVGDEGELSDWQKRLLDRRLDEAAKDPDRLRSYTDEELFED
jgi:hypothetical protein